MRKGTDAAATFFSKYRLPLEITVVVVVVLSVMTLAKYNQTPAVQTMKESTPLAPPPMTEYIVQALEKSQGFQHLVSYSDNGFEPTELDIKKGDIVRFSNNSSHDLWVATVVADSGRLYPAGVQETCGQSAFDSCVSMKPFEFWEFKFDVVGEWSYRNNASERFAVIRVK